MEMMILLVLVCICFVLATRPVQHNQFQVLVGDWMEMCFSLKVCNDITERGDRLLEETLELLQAHGYDPRRVATLTEYVFSKPIGEPRQEMGDVMVTLAAYSNAARTSYRVAGARSTRSAPSKR